MRLTNHIRDAIVNAVIADIPTVDYGQKEQDLADKAARRSMPPRVREMAADSQLSCYLTRQRIESNCKTPGGNYLLGYWVFGLVEGDKIQFTDAEKKRLRTLREKGELQRQKIRTAKNKLRSALTGFTTVKQLCEAMPEIASYAPTQQEKTKNLPATTDVIPALQDAGWKKRKAA